MMTKALKSIENVGGSQIAAITLPFASMSCSVVHIAPKFEHSITNVQKSKKA